MTRKIVPQPRWDVIIAGDLTLEGDRAFRIALEVRHYRRSRCHVGLLHVTGPSETGAIAREIGACTRRGIAAPVDPRVEHSARLVVIHGPSALKRGGVDLASITADKLILVAYSEADYQIEEMIARQLPTALETRWAATSDVVRQTAPANLKHTRSKWLPPEMGHHSPVPSESAPGTPAIGWIVCGQSAHPPYESLPDAEVFALAMDAQRPRLADDVRLLDIASGHISLERLVRRLSALAFFPLAGVADLPDALILTALRAGKPVALPPHLEGRYGEGAIYCEGGDALRSLVQQLASPGVTGRSKASPTDRHRRDRASLPVLIGTATEAVAEPGEPRPVMFMIGGGTGVGHVARLLAIARKMDPDVPIIFVCQSHAVSAIEKLGYVAEYFPSASYVGGSVDVWNKWLQHRLDLLIDDYDPSLVVFDGNHLYPSLIRAVASRADCKLAWVRRGLWGQTFSRYLASSRWCDLIVEPGELTGQPDSGVTSQRRYETTLVPPIRLLEQTELLSRSEAAKALGLDPAAPAVLVQLGVNSTRETVSLTDAVVRELQKSPGLQICIAEFAGLVSEVGYWPGVTYVRGFPLSQYLRAFDFSVAAAGYNTFHEVIGFALPTIFVPNRDPSMDDQAGRAAFAQDSGAAFELDEEGFDDLPSLIKLLLEPKGRDYLAGNCEKIRLPNGASAAARALSQLTGAAA